MPRPTKRKRPLEEKDPNVSTTPYPSAAADKEAKNAKPPPPPGSKSETESSPQFPGRRHPSPPPPDYDAFSLPDLKAECKKRGLPVSGRSWELRERLQNADHESSVPVKQAIEAGARKRRAEKGVRRTDPPKHDVSHFWRELEPEVLRRGPRGQPMYDELGYELSYDKLSTPPRTPRYRPSWSKMEKWMEKNERELEAKAAIMGTTATATAAERVGGLTTEMWDDRVAQDLEIPLHKVEVCDYERWKRRGFKFNPQNITDQDRARVENLQPGSAFRR